MFEKRKEAGQDGPATQFDGGQREQALKQPGTSSGRAAVIGPRIRINGDVSGDENLVIEGFVEGKVSLGEYRVEVGSAGRVVADIEAKVVQVDGEVQGDISGTEKVTISRSGNVRGNITAPRMTLEDGAKFKGSIDMDPGEPEPARKQSAGKNAAKKEHSATSNGKGPAPEAVQNESLALKGS